MLPNTIKVNPEYVSSTGIQGVDFVTVVDVLKTMKHTSNSSLKL